MRRCRCAAGRFGRASICPRINRGWRKAGGRGNAISPITGTAPAGCGMQITGATPVIWSEVWANGLTFVNADDGIIPGYRAAAARRVGARAIWTGSR